MSADNEIMIAKFTDGYRVAHICGWPGAGDHCFLPEFCTAKVFQTKKEAWIYSEEIYKDIIENGCGYVEYGTTFREYDCTYEEALKKFC